jgi:hypothetical protein
MSPGFRSLWEILVASRGAKNDARLNCDECFILMEHLAHVAVDWLDLDEARVLVMEHMQHCPACREHHLKKLEELEQAWKKSQRKA